MNHFTTSRTRRVPCRKRAQAARFLLYLGVFLVSVFPGSTLSYAQTAEELREQVESGSYAQELKRFYEQREYRPAWVRAGRPGTQAAAFAAALRRTDDHGLSPDDYAFSEIRSRLEAAQGNPLSTAEAARLDLLLTGAFLQYGEDLLQGRVDPQRLHAGWNLPGRRKNLVELLQASLEAEEIEAALARLAPPHPEYAALQRALLRYRALAEEGGWPSVPDGPPLRQGDRDPRVPTLRERLRISGDHPPVQPDSLERFDAVLERAVRTFQERHGLVVDGIVGRQTRAVLNVPAAERVRQIEVNLERARWLPEHLGRRYLHVNTAGYRLEVVEDGTPVLAMRVIVGKPSTPTPLFSARLTEVVLAPYWNVPASIARNEIWPEARRDSTYLVRHDMRVLSGGRIRQDPGPANPLGRVKFTITNPFSIGLHDTPERHLFREATCAFSHGCIRAEEPIALAAYVLRDDPDWTRERIEAAIRRWKETRIPVREPIPVYVLYRTAWMDGRGAVQFRADLYGHDAALARELDGR